MASRLLDTAGRTIIDGNRIPNYRTLEGPKFYKANGYYYVFAPAGGVEQGWQAVFRSRTIDGPVRGTHRHGPGHNVHQRPAPGRLGTRRRMEATGSCTSRTRARSGVSSTYNPCSGKTTGR